MPRTSSGSCAPRWAARLIVSRSRSLCSTVDNTFHATCLSGPRSLQISFSQMWVVSTVRSNTSRPLALIAPLPISRSSAVCSERSDARHRSRGSWPVPLNRPEPRARGTSVLLERLSGVMRARRKKVGVLTFHKCINYGSYWQARCLVEWLLARGHDAELLDHDCACVRRAEAKCALQPKLPERTPV